MKGFFKRNLGLILSPIAVFVMYFVELAILGVYPFGNSIAASYDLSAQIAPFYEHLFDVLDGKSSLFYSYAVAGGADVFGTFAYFAVSPFSFLYLMFGDGNVLNACGVVMAFKVAAIAFSGAFFVKKLFPSFHTLLGGGIGIVYAYCGYTFVASTYVNWLDFLIYLPFCAIAFKRFAVTGKYFLFSFTAACCIYTCFSIACFSLFTVFPVLIAYGLICVKKEDKGLFLCRLCLAFFVAVLLALPLLTGALMAYLRSGRGGGLFDELWYGFTVKDGVRIFDAKQYYNRAGEAWYRKFSYIFSDSVFLLFTIAYLAKTGCRTRFSKFFLLTGIFTLIPVFADEAMLLMNMGSYMSYALRFGFLNALYLLGGGCLGIECLLKEHTEVQAGKKRRAATIAFWSVTAVIAVVLTLFTAGNGYATIWEKIISDSELLNGTKSFPSRYAHSLGGLQVTAVLFLLLTVVFLTGRILLRKGGITKRVFTVAIAALVGIQVLFYNEQIVLGNRAGKDNFDAYGAMTSVLNEREEGYFRIKDYGDAITSNVPFSGGGNSFSVFSSVIDKDNFEVARLFGYGGNARNNMKSSSGTAFGDAFLGYKYFFAGSEANKNGNWERVDNLAYTKRVEKEAGSDEQLAFGNYSMFENTYAFPYAFTVKSGEFRFPAENTSENRTVNQAALYDFLNGTTGTSASISSRMTGNLSEKIWKKNAARGLVLEVAASQISVSLKANAGEYLFLSFVASKGYEVTVNGRKAELIENDLHFLFVALDEGENVVEFIYRSPYASYAGVGVWMSAVGFAVVAFVERRAKRSKAIAMTVAVAGVLLAVAVVAFFMVYPTGIWIYKMFKSI